MMVCGILLAIGTVVALRPRAVVRVRAARVTIDAVRDVVSSASAGEVIPERQATVRAETAGRVLMVAAGRGAPVQQGQLVVQIDPSDLGARIQQAQAAVRVAEAQQAQATARLSALRTQARRAQLLATAGAGTVSLSDDARNAVAEGESALSAATAQRNQAAAALQVVAVQRARCELAAPFAGLLTEVPIQVGDSVAPMAVLFQLTDASRLHVDATVDEADAARMRVGQVAELRLDALPGRQIQGRVARVDPIIKRDLKGARTLTVEVEVLHLEEARAAGLLPGMSANTDIVVAQKRQVLSVPSNVIIGRGVSRSVYLLEPQGRGGRYRARKVPVGVGISNWERTEITSGLTEAALVVASLNEKGLDDGALVELVQD